MRISVIISTIDRAQSLLKTLRDLEQQDYEDFEVIVVVGPTKDQTLELLSQFSGRVRVLQCPTDNLSLSRNIGVRAAAGEIVAFIDDDAFAGRRWLSQIADHFSRNSGLTALGGIVYLCLPGQERVQHRYGLVSSLAEHVDVNEDWHLLTPSRDWQGSFWTIRPMGTNMAFRREVLLEIGGFDEFISYTAEESELSLRLAWHGYRIEHCDDLVVYHLPQSSRNRTVNTSKGRWHLSTRSLVYFALKNGAMVGDPPHKIAARALYLLKGHLRWYYELFKGSSWSLCELIKGYVLEVAVFLEAIVAGVLAPRRLALRDKCSANESRQDPIFKKSLSSMRPLRIAVAYSNYAPPGQDGIGRLVDGIAAGLTGRGHEVHIIARSDRGEQVSLLKCGKLHRIPYDLSRYSGFAHLPRTHHVLNYSHAVYRKLKHLVKAEGIDVLISPLWLSEGLVTAVSSTLPVITIVETSTKKINEVHNESSPDNEMLAELEGLLIHESKQVVCISQAAAQMVKDLYASSGIDTRLLYPGIAVEEQVTGSDGHQLAPHTSKELTVLYVGRLEKRKGIQTLLRAIPVVLDRVPNARFVIAGRDNSQHDGFQQSSGLSYPEFFKQNYPRLLHRVSFLGHVDESRLRQLYCECDVFVAPSLFESFGFVFLEAMSRGKPIVSCRAGAIPEVVEHDVCGILVKPGDHFQLAEALVTLLEDMPLRREMGEAGRRRVIERFTLSRMAQQLEELITQVVRG